MDGPWYGQRIKDFGGPYPFQPEIVYLPGLVWEPAPESHSRSAGKVYVLKESKMASGGVEGAGFNYRFEFSGTAIGDENLVPVTGSPGPAPVNMLDYVGVHHIPFTIQNPNSVVLRVDLSVQGLSVPRRSDGVESKAIISTPGSVLLPSDGAQTFQVEFNVVEQFNVGEKILFDLVGLVDYA